MTRPILGSIAGIGFSLCLAFAATARAQVPEPAPSPSLDPHVYSDDAMNFTAPASYYLVGMRHINPKDLQGPVTVAQWVANPGKSEQRAIQITIEPNDGTSLDGFETAYSNELREQVDGVLINNKERMSTPNGMPVYFLTITSGDGFNAIRSYAIIWPDGVRGVTVSVTAHLGVMGADEAKTVLKNIYAVLYPLRREQSSQLP